MLVIDRLEAGYGRLHVLFGVSASFPDKAITVIVGPNGSGKSTLLRSVFGLTRIYSGKIFFDGHDITGLPPHKVSKLGLSYLPQLNNIFENLTVRENLLLATYGLEKEEARERIREVKDMFPVIEANLNRKAGAMSGGERQMLAMAISLIRRPRVMLFDEPTGNLSPKMALQVLDHIIKLKEIFGITIILVEQNAKRALEYGEYAHLLVSGQLIYSGSARSLLDDQEFGRLYLGLR